MEGNIEPKVHTKESVEMEILNIRDQVAMRGGNDHEIPTLNQLVEKLQKGDILPEIALKQAYALLSRKQDYH